MNRSEDKDAPWISECDVDKECWSGHELSHLILTRSALAIVNSWQQIEHFHSETGKLQSQDPDTEIKDRAGWDQFFPNLVYC